MNYLENVLRPEGAGNSYSRRLPALECSSPNWLPLLNLPIIGTSAASSKPANRVNIDRLILTHSPAENDIDQLIQEVSQVRWATRAVFERSRCLQALIRPLLSHTTWNEVINVARRGRQVLPTELREASILRLDIADFTELLNNHPLDEVLVKLNAYLDRLTQLVYRHHGDVDKFLGDGFLAVFADADDAVQAGCAIQQTVADFNRSQAVPGGLLFPARIGIDTGQVITTNLGSPDRQERTVIGMPANLAERLQAQATPGRVWLSQATFERLRDQSNCRCLGPIQVKGQPKPIFVYEKQDKEIL